MLKPNSFRSLKIEGWRQFDNIDIDLHPTLTVITGANGAGKSSILRIFSRHFGYDRPLLATPSFNSGGGYSYLTGVFESIWKKFTRKKTTNTDVGTLTYTNGVESPLQVPNSGGVQYSLGVPNQQGLFGIHIDSHHPISPYQTVGQIPANFILPENAYQIYHNEIHSKYHNGHSGYSHIYRMKEALISMAMFGEGNAHIQKNPAILNAYLGFTDILRKVLPESLGFIDLSIRPPEVVIVSKSGEFLLDAASGGLMVLIDIAWRLYMYSLQNESFVVTMDEPENHLHPVMQRTLMPKLIDAFPKAQFIIATHSPFMVSSIKDSYVYVLRYLSREQESSQKEVNFFPNRVVSERLDTINKGGTASEILREVLGVDTTIPEWVERSLEEVVERFRSQPITEDLLKKLRSELIANGYENLYPNALASILENK